MRAIAVILLLASSGCVPPVLCAKAVQDWRRYEMADVPLAERTVGLAPINVAGVVDAFAVEWQTIGREVPRRGLSSFRLVLVARQWHLQINGKQWTINGQYIDDDHEIRIALADLDGDPKPDGEIAELLGHELTHLAECERTRLALSACDPDAEHLFWTQHPGWDQRIVQRWRSAP